MQDILINWTPFEVRVALVEDGALQELHLEQSSERVLVGNIYLGKVSRVLPGMQSAFVDIGLERAAFLHVSDIWRAPLASGEPAPLVPIEQQVFEGQSLMVQVLKEPIGSKGARLSTHISIAGQMLVFLPQEQRIGVSQKITAESFDALRQRLGFLVGATGGGFILRTNAEHASDQQLLDDIAYLRRVWAGIQKAATELAAGSLLHQDLNLMQRVLRDMATADTRSILIDSKQQFNQLCAFAAEFMPTLVPKLHHYQEPAPIFDLHCINDEITRALLRRVDLKSGGYLVIDQNEALTAIDVNTGFFVGTRNFEDTIFQTNMEAAKVIARQLRLRNLGGIIVIDFIDMQSASQRQLVLAEMRRQLARDRVKTTCGDFSSLGLLELTRKRSRESLAQLLRQPCACCGGLGSIKTARSVSYDIFRELLRQARQFKPSQLRLLAAPIIIDALLGAQSQQLALFCEFLGIPVVLQSDPAMNQEQYRILLAQ